MDDPFSQGFPFSLGSIRPSAISKDEGAVDTLFQPLIAELPNLELRDHDKRYQQDIDVLELSELNGVEVQGLVELESEFASPASLSIENESQSLEPLIDVWQLDVGLDDSKVWPTLQTWEAFEKRDVPNAERSAYLSEAGPEVFNSALAHWEKRSSDMGVLPQDVMLRAFHNLIVGRSSLFFQWNEAKQSFTRTLADTPVSGYSAASSQTLIDSLIGFGSTYRCLRELSSDTASLQNSLPTIIAFHRCIERILDSIEQHIATNMLRTSSVLQLQGHSQRSRYLLEMLKGLADPIEGCFSDEDVISIISDQVYHLVSGGTCFSETLRLVLTRVSAPWLEALGSDIGLVSNRTGPINHEEGRATEAGVEDADTPFQSQTRNPATLPNFVTDDDCALILETKASLKLLRQYVPDHGIATIDLLSPAPSEFTQLDAKKLWQATLENFTLAALHSGRSGGSHDDSALEKAYFGPSTDGAEHLAWAEYDAQQDYLSALDARMCQTATEQSADTLQETVINALETNKTSPESLSPLETMETNLLGRLRPSIRMQARLINRTLLHHLFVNCRLRHHLDLQRQYHLLGNGDFVSRLSTALFSTETQSAERKRGTIRTGETMGLRLGTRDGQRWPPASSELRLTLMGILTETYHPEIREQRVVRDSKELPGGLSFSVRELSDSDIEKVMDTGSIYALDFLRLQYTAPPCVDAILTSSSMATYDNIFRLLLRMLRVLHVTTRLRGRHCPRYTAFNHAEMNISTDLKVNSRFAVQAHHITSTLMSSFMDIGVEAPWKDFSYSVSQIERAIDAGGQHPTSESKPLLGLDSLCELHKSCLERLRSRLFLRQRQAKTRNAIEAVLNTILECSSAMESREPANVKAMVAGFEQAVKDMLRVLRETADKPPKLTPDNETAEAEAEATKILMLRLDWNGSYSGTVQNTVV